MALERILRTGYLTLSTTDAARIQHHLDRLERRLVHHPAPSAVLAFTPHRLQRQIEIDLRVELGPLGGHLISHQRAETADRAVRLAVEDVERQLERRHARQTGEPTYGVPSRRLPATTRPAHLSAVGNEEDTATDQMDSVEPAAEPTQRER